MMIPRLQWAGRLVPTVLQACPSLSIFWNIPRCFVTLLRWCSFMTITPSKKQAEFERTMVTVCTIQYARSLNRNRPYQTATYPRTRMGLPQTWSVYSLTGTQSHTQPY
ncbi:hypothetical protein B0I75DRAFT_137054, partial [Yarrowia lipolytica]